MSAEIKWEAKIDKEVQFHSVGDPKLGAIGPLHRHELTPAVIATQQEEQHKAVHDELLHEVESLMVADEVTKGSCGTKPPEKKEEKPVGKLLPLKSTIPPLHPDEHKLEERIEKKLEKVEEYKKPDIVAEGMHKVREEEEHEKEERKEHRKEKARELRDKLKGPLPPKRGELLTEHDKEVERKRDEEYEKLAQLEEGHERRGDHRPTDDEKMTINGHPPEFQQIIGRHQQVHGEPGFSTKWHPVLGHPDVKQADIHEDRIKLPIDASSREYVRQTGTETSTFPPLLVKVDVHEKAKLEPIQNKKYSDQELKKLAQKKT
jgi:hypothetical protein